MPSTRKMAPLPFIRNASISRRPLSSNGCLGPATSSASTSSGIGAVDGLTLVTSNSSSVLQVALELRLAVAVGDRDLLLLLRHPLEQRRDPVLEPLDLRRLRDRLVLALVLEAEAEVVGADLELLRAHHLHLQLLHLALAGLFLDLLVVARSRRPRSAACPSSRSGTRRAGRARSGDGLQLGRQLLRDVRLDGEVVGQVARRSPSTPAPACRRGSRSGRGGRTRGCRSG